MAHASIRDDLQRDIETLHRLGIIDDADRSDLRATVTVMYPPAQQMSDLLTLHEHGLLSEQQFRAATSKVAGAGPPESPKHLAKARQVVATYDDRMLLHKGPEHPECPERAAAVWKRLQDDGILEKCVVVPAREATDEELRRVHSEGHVERVNQTAEPGGLALSDHKKELRIKRGYSNALAGDVYDCQHSSLAARIAAGCLIDVVTAVVDGSAPCGCAVARPPGHHANATTARGFCFFNNVAVAAAHAREKLGLSRVLIVDWDVHHGNGTQDIFEDDPSVAFVSVHLHKEGKFYPGTGAAAEIGSGRGKGATLNVPWPQAKMGNADYDYVFDEVVLPYARHFDPELVIVSAGFDASEGDPLGQCSVTPPGFARMAAALTNLAGGKVAMILEGGYNISATAAAYAACGQVLLEAARSTDGSAAVPAASGDGEPSASALRAAARAARAHAAVNPALAAKVDELERRAGPEEPARPPSAAGPVEEARRKPAPPPPVSSSKKPPPPPPRKRK